MNERKERILIGMKRREECGKEQCKRGAKRLKVINKEEKKGGKGDKVKKRRIGNEKRRREERNGERRR